MKQLGYRSDIEGLRAICVLGVVFYHAGFSQVPGGFVGVDAFFVISGFLITGLLIKELGETGQINLIAFWARRARRLLPNALLTLGAVLLAAAWFAPASVKASVWQDAIAAVLYVSNYFFATRTVDYFDHTVASSPLLHFWSLSVEEQFYFIWPAIIGLICLAKAGNPRRSALIALTVLTIASFAAAMIWISKSQPAAFFHTEGRLWQLGVGGLLAFGFGGIQRLSKPLLSAGAWVGLAGLLASLVVYSDQLVYPGLWALLPTVSTVLLLAGGNASPMAPVVLLSFPLLTWIGRLSYSIYLWHWPVLVFTPRALGWEKGEAIWFALGLTLLLSAAAYYLIENPIRRSKWSQMRAPATLATGLGLSAAVAVAAVLFPSFVLQDLGKSDIQRQALKADTDRVRKYAGKCRNTFDKTTDASCIFGVKTASKRVVLLGDSHAGHMFPAVEAAALEKGWALYAFIRPSCPPIEVDVYNWTKKSLDRACIDWRKSAIEGIIAARPDHIVISHWTGWAKKMMRGKAGEQLSETDARRVYIQGLSATLKKFKDAGLSVTLVRGTPKNRRDGVLDCIIDYGPQHCGTARQEAVEEDVAEFEAARNVGGIGELDLTEHFCGKNVCQAVIDGKIVYRDATHITAMFARSLAPEFAKLLN
jgi:peptidoglycan/LPS O-acetylase OafA/YrhL